MSRDQDHIEQAADPWQLTHADLRVFERGQRYTDHRHLLVAAWRFAVAELRDRYGLDLTIDDVPELRRAIDRERARRAAERDAREVLRALARAISSTVALAERMRGDCGGHVSLARGGAAVRVLFLLAAQPALAAVAALVATLLAAVEAAPEVLPTPAPRGETDRALLAALFKGQGLDVRGHALLAIVAGVGADDGTLATLIRTRGAATVADVIDREERAVRQAIR